MSARRRASATVTEKPSRSDADRAASLSSNRTVRIAGGDLCPITPL
jgi:hypothetical protein